MILPNPLSPPSKETPFGRLQLAQRALELAPKGQRAAARRELVEANKAWLRAGRASNG